MNVELRLKGESEIEHTISATSTCSSLSDIIVTPRAIQISGTNHLSAAGLRISNSIYEDGERPAGIKHNFL